MPNKSYPKKQEDIELYWSQELKNEFDAQDTKDATNKKIVFLGVDRDDMDFDDNNKAWKYKKWEELVGTKRLKDLKKDAKRIYEFESVSGIIIITSNSRMIFTVYNLADFEKELADNSNKLIDNYLIKRHIEIDKNRTQILLRIK